MFSCATGFVSSGIASPPGSDLPFRFLFRKKRMLQNLIDVLNQNHFQIFQYIGRNIRQILFVVLGNNHGSDIPPMSRKQFFFQPSDRQHPAPQGDLTRHGQIPSDLPADEGRGNGGRHRNAGGGSVLGNRPFRYMDMNIRLLVETFRQSELSGPSTNVGQRRLRRLLHDVTQLSGQGHLSGPLHDGDFDDQQFPAHLGPGETDRQADFIPPLGFPMTEFRYAQVSLNGL